MRIRRPNLYCSALSTEHRAKKLLRGGRVADPFAIARAACENRIVVTTELMKPNAVKIPNICAHFGVGCMSLAEFMDAENWTF